MNTIDDYIYLIDVAKTNLTTIINNKIKEYKKYRSQKLKSEIIELMNERKKIYLFDICTIDKYL